MLEGEFRLTLRERTELRDRMRSRTLPAEEVRRARLILLLVQGKSYLTIRLQLGCNPNYISRWKGASRLSGWPGRTRAIADGRWRNEPRRWRRRFWSGRADLRRTAPPTGVAATWPGTWALAI